MLCGEKKVLNEGQEGVRNKVTIEVVLCYGMLALLEHNGKWEEVINNFRDVQVEINWRVQSVWKAPAHLGHTFKDSHLVAQESIIML